LPLLPRVFLLAFSKRRSSFRHSFKTPILGRYFARMYETQKIQNNKTSRRDITSVAPAALSMAAIIVLLSSNTAEEHLRFQKKRLNTRGLLYQSVRTGTAPLGLFSQSEGAVWSVFEVKSEGYTLVRQLLAFGSVLLSFNLIEVELFDEFENALRIAVILSAGSALEGLFGIWMHRHSGLAFTTILRCLHRKA
jgi:hypothetical protein